ncbi:fe-containing alcohol protein [Stemphylium lycopersici]|uniref:Fe-containing alcohol protein n=1 Tax=Stemphylium lycopersici TaxID=183478 RepID=A0A364NF39_STELY|nr:fe-containing alcohol protein [Stemphylium lycopersici]RAR15934.1 fe-containing alcohol protein [Stemphylium lycopersici]
MAAMHAPNPQGFRPNHHLPPSPPPSPPATRRRHKKKPDPFEQLATTPLPSAPSSPANELEGEKEPLLTRIILTPVLSISFLLSLFLVNYRNRARRTEAHSSGTSILTYLVPLSWLDPEPYQDPDDSTWGRRGTVGHVEPHDAIGPRPDEQSDEKKSKKKKKRSWHLNKKIRKVAKLEVGDALEMRERVMLGMAIVMAIGCAALWMGFKWLYVYMSQALSGMQK